MSTSVDGDVFGQEKQPIVPTSPFGIQVTKDALQRRIDKGDITQADVDILKKSYQWMAISSVVGGLIYFPTFMLMRRRRPPLGIWTCLGGATGMGMLGSFLGFAVGGAAAAQEITSNMQDSGRKMKVFQQIVIDSQRAIEEARMKGELPPVRAPSRTPSGSTSSSTRGTNKWDDPIAIDEIRAEQDREANFGQEIGQITSDAEFASTRSSPSSSPSSASSSSSSTSTGPKSANSGSEIIQKTERVWDKIRKQSLPARKTPDLEGGNEREAGALGLEGGGGTVSGLRRDTRSKEQIEFDALLEKERSGVAEKDVWN